MVEGNDASAFKPLLIPESLSDEGFVVVVVVVVGGGGGAVAAAVVFA